MASTRFARPVWYDGRTITAADMRDATEAQYNRNEHSRKSVGSRFLRQAPRVTWVTAGPPTNPTMRLENIDGFHNLLPIYGDGPFDFDPTISNQLQLDGVTGEIGSNDVSGAGQFKSVIIGVSYTERLYDPNNDVTGTEVNFRADDGVCVKVVSGVEESSADPADPTLPADIIPIAKIIRSFNDDAAMIAGTTIIQLIQTDLTLDSTLVAQEVFSRSLLNGGMATVVNRSAGSHADRFLPRLKIDVDGDNDTIMVRDDLEFHIQGQIRRISDVYVGGTDDGEAFFFQSPALVSAGVGTRFYLRARLDTYNALQLYVLQGTEPGTGLNYTENPNAGPDPTGSSGGEVSTNAFDVLLGVVTESTGPTFTLTTAFDNNPDFTEVISVAGNFAGGQDTVPAPEVESLSRACAHALRARAVRDLSADEGASHPTNRVIGNSGVEVLAVKHQTVDIQRVGRYWELVSTDIQNPSSDVFFQSACRVFVSTQFVW